MPRLMMSRPLRARSVARARTAKAFSSPMRPKAGTMGSMAFPGGFLGGLLGKVLGRVARVLERRSFRPFKTDLARRVKHRRGSFASAMRAARGPQDEMRLISG